MARTKKWSRSQIFRTTADKLAAVWAGIPPIPGPELTRLPRLVGDPNETPRTDPCVGWNRWSTLCWSARQRNSREPVWSAP